MNFNQQEITCNICCEQILPMAAVRLGCSHGWYCLDCVGRHAEARLAVGSANVNCPECCTPIAERDLRMMLPKKFVERLLARSLEQAVSSVSDLWACPTPNCAMRVALEEGDEPRLQCTICKKESCLRCGCTPYHKDMTCEEHAKKLRAQGRTEDEDALRRWMQETGTKCCPQCGMGVTKQNLAKQNTQYQECHKMMCSNCSTRFCFKCCAILTDNFSCGCSIDAHGFWDHNKGTRVGHLEVPRPAKRGHAAAVAVATKGNSKAKNVGRKAGR